VTDTYGLLPIPLDAPTGAPGETLGDPCLAVLLDAFKAVLNANMADAWSAAGVAANMPPVREVFAHDPSKLVFLEKSLPALFLWREGSAAEYFDQTPERRIATDTLKLVWVYPTAPPEKQRVRATFERAVVGIIDGFLKRNRDPAWVAVGDTTDRARRTGSNLLTKAGFFSLRMTRSALVPVTIEMSDGLPQRTYAAVQMDLTIEEAHAIGGFDAMQAGGTTTIQSAELDGNGDPFVYAVVDLPV
jgi:hypothetical protein